MLLILVTALLFIIVFLLIALILLQNPKDESGYNTLGRGSIQYIVGAAQAPYLLQKITYGLATLFFVFTLTTTYLLTQREAAKKPQTHSLSEVEDYIVTTPREKEVKSKKKKASRKQSK